MKKALLITHQFLEESDFKNKEFWKLKVFKYTLKRYRELNPNSYIILVGHGENIPQAFLEYVDWSYWHHELISNDINWGHPICVKIGIQHCIEKNIKYITKVRLDSINLIKDISSLCQELIGDNDKFIITSFSYKTYELMDLFYSGSVDSLDKLYEYKTWKLYWADFNRQGGTYPLAHNFFKNILNMPLPKKFNFKEWIDLIDTKVIIVSPFQLNWINLREHHNLVDRSQTKLIFAENSHLLKNFMWTR
tara:strand:+ start:578 stop:1324 length:747 start_codon:yes stop_codon:yes gene_type:complete